MMACIWASCADTAGPFCPESPPALILNYGENQKMVRLYCNKDDTSTQEALAQNTKGIAEKNVAAKKKNIFVESIYQQHLQHFSNTVSLTWN